VIEIEGLNLASYDDRIFVVVVEQLWWLILIL